MILQFVFTADTIRPVIHWVFRAVVCRIGVSFVVVVSYYVRIVIAIVAGILLSALSVRNLVVVGVRMRNMPI